MSKTITEQSLPSSVDAEAAVLGSIIVNNSNLDTVAERLHTRDFYTQFNRDVFEAMLKLGENGQKIDPLLINEEINRNGSFSSIAEISGLTAGVPGVMDLEIYTSLIRKKSIRREIIETCRSTERDARDCDSDSDVSNLLAGFETRVHELRARAEADEKITYFTRLDHVIDGYVLPALDDLSKGTSRKIPTGFPLIDAAIGGGLARSDVMLIAADTGCGKSALALQFAYKIAKSDVPVAFLAGEMSSGENVLRLLSQVSGITNLNWKHQISRPEHEALKDWAAEIKEVPIYFEHTLSDLQTLRTHLRTLVREHKIQVLVIDYVQLFKLGKLDRRSRSERIAEASQEIRLIANELNIAIIEIAQLNREGARASTPGIHDLEGSGQLEKDASLILILELDKKQCIDEYDRKFQEARIRIEKGRNVGRGKVTGRFYGSSVRFIFGEKDDMQ